MIAAIYARKSTEQLGVADDQKSVARQIEHACSYATRKGWTVDESFIFADDGISGAVFGYRNREVLGPDGRRSHVVRETDPARAAVVRRIFALCAQGYGKVAIAKRLNSEGAPAPRAQQGRPNAWAPSSVREALYRDLYRGVIVWNRTKKRDDWGRTHAKARPESEWLRLPAPELRIVTDAEWQAAHARLEVTRCTYLRSTNGQLWGRPASGVASKYLLTGIARCGVCGAGLEVRSRKQGTRREFFYSCSSYYRRGTTVCPNRYEIPMVTADAAVIETLLGDLLTPDRLADVAKRAVRRAASAHESADVTRAQLTQQLADTETALTRLTAAIAAGGNVPALVAAIKTADETRLSLQARISALARPVPNFDRSLDGKLRGVVDEWRAVLGRQLATARQIVTKLVDGRVTFQPEECDGRAGFRFQAIGTVAKLLDGVIYGGNLSLQAVASPTVPSWNQINAFLTDLKGFREKLRNPPGG